MVASTPSSSKYRTIRAKSVLQMMSLFITTSGALCASSTDSAPAVPKGLFSRT